MFNKKKEEIIADAKIDMAELLDMYKSGFLDGVTRGSELNHKQKKEFNYISEVQKAFEKRFFKKAKVRLNRKV